MLLDRHRLDRRRFLQSSLALGVSAGVGNCFPFPLWAAATQQRASVLDFGADPTGAQDATAAVRRAIASLAPDSARLVFPAGKYRFKASDETALQFTGFSGIDIYANNAELFFAGNTAPLGFRFCKNVGLHDMKLDWERPAFSQGVVKQADGHSFTIEIDQAFPVTGSERFSALAEFDAQTRRPAANGLNVRALAASATLVAPQSLRITLPIASEGSLPVRPGMLLVLLHTASPTRSTGCFVFEGCEDILMDDVSVRHAPATAFVLRGCTNLQMDGVSVSAGLGVGAERLLAANGDALHCSDCHGKLLLKEVHFEGIGGDAVNIYQSYWKIAERSDDRTIVIAAGDNPGLAGHSIDKWELPEPGDFIQFSSPASLQLLGEIGISSVEPAKQGGVRLTFPETLSPVIVPGTLVCGVVDAPRISLDHATIANTLGRGLVLHSRGEITNNHFQGCSQEAILLAPDSRSFEGPAVQNIRIRANTFEDCITASASQCRGIITVDTSRECNTDAGTNSTGAAQLALNSGVRIQDNTFIRSTGAAIYAVSVDELVITQNTLGHAPASPPGQTPVAIVLRDVANAELSNNISNMPQTVAMTHCADTVAMQDNHLLTAADPGAPGSRS